MKKDPQDLNSLNYNLQESMEKQDTAKEDKDS